MGKRDMSSLHINIGDLFSSSALKHCDGCDRVVWTQGNLPASAGVCQRPLTKHFATQA